MSQFFKILSENKRFFAGTVLVGVLTAIPLVAAFLTYTLPEIEEKIEDSRRKSVQIAVESAFNIIDSFHQKALSGELSEAQAQDLAKEQIKTLRYQGLEYFWINDTSPSMVMHPFQPKLDGQDLKDYKDPNGKRLFVEMAETSTKHGAGYVYYMWPKQSGGDPVPKVSYVKLYKPWNWILGSGVYIDDVQAEISAIRKANMYVFALASLIVIFIACFSGFRQLNKIVLPIRKVISDLQETSEELSETANNVTSASSIMSEAVSIQASSMHETSSSVTEISQTSLKNVDSASSASASAQATEKLINEAQMSIQQMMKAIEDISLSNDDVAQSMRSNQNHIKTLSKILEDINNKTKFINDIVFQTKLLSFNASVEAARAGEHGKGFAVVAEEIGNLAKMSGTSADEIASILSESQSTLSEILNEVESSVERILVSTEERLKRGRSVAQQCDTLLKEVVVKAQESSSLSNEITLSSKEQEIGIREITNAVSSIETANQSTLREMKKTAESAQALMQRVSFLRGLILNLSVIVQGHKKLPNNVVNLDSDKDSDFESDIKKAA